MTFRPKQRTAEALAKDKSKGYLPTSEEDTEFEEADFIEDMSDADLFDNDIYGEAYDFEEDFTDGFYNEFEEESKSKKVKSNYKLVDDVDMQDTRFNPDLPLGTLSDLIITQSLASEGRTIRVGTVAVRGEISSDNKVLPREIEYKGKTYSTLDLLNTAKSSYSKEINSGKMKEPKLEDLYIPTKEVFINGEKKVIIDFENFQDIIDYIFNNPCK